MTACFNSILHICKVTVCKQPKGEKNRDGSLFFRVCQTFNSDYRPFVMSQKAQRIRPVARRRLLLSLINFCLVPTLCGAMEAPPGAAAFCPRAVTRGLNKLLLACGTWVCLHTSSQTRLLCSTWGYLFVKLSHRHISVSELIHSQVPWGWTFTSRVLEPLAEFPSPWELSRSYRIFRTRWHSGS